MPDTQALQLRRMMQREHHQSCLEVCLPPVYMKKKEIESFEAGDLLMLDLKQLELDILEDDIPAARASYGIRNGKPHICISKIEKKRVSSYNSKKYEKIKIFLGTIEKDRVEEGNIIVLKQAGGYDAVLYAEDLKVANTRFVMTDQKIALQIIELLRDEG